MTRRTHSDREIRILVARSSVGLHHVPLGLARANLEMSNLSHVDLSHADLTGASLRGAMLWGARLGGACLDGADLTCANLTWCNLTSCTTRGTILLEADLDEASVGAGFSGAITAGADMVTSMFTLDRWAAAQVDAAPSEDALVAEARAARERSMLEAHIANATPALRARGAVGFASKGERLVEAQARVLSDADLRALLAWSTATGKPLNLRGCNLGGADLRDARLDGACLAFTDLRGANTGGASFARADLAEAAR